jgi:hypothetical protein
LARTGVQRAILRNPPALHLDKPPDVLAGEAVLPSLIVPERRWQQAVDRLRRADHGSEAIPQIAERLAHGLLVADQGSRSLGKAALSGEPFSSVQSTLLFALLLLGLPKGCGQKFSFALQFGQSRQHVLTSVLVGAESNGQAGLIAVALGGFDLGRALGQFRPDNLHVRRGRLLGLGFPAEPTHAAILPRQTTHRFRAAYSRCRSRLRSKARWAARYSLSEINRPRWSAKLESTTFPSSILTLPVSRQVVRKVVGERPEIRAPTTMGTSLGRSEEGA